MIKLFAVIGLLAVGFYFGWLAAHVMVATECKRLGGFFVGSEVYQCHQVEKREGRK